MVVWLYEYMVWETNFELIAEILSMQENRRAVGLDIRVSDELNILTTNGFLQHVYQVCKLDSQQGAGFLAAPVCSSFVYMSLAPNNCVGMLGFQRWHCPTMGP